MPLIEEVAWQIHDRYNSVGLNQTGIIDARIAPVVAVDLEVYAKMYGGHFFRPRFEESDTAHYVLEFIPAHPPLLDTVTKIKFFDMSHQVPAWYHLFHHRDLGYNCSHSFALALEKLIKNHNQYCRLPQIN